MRYKIAIPGLVLLILGVVLFVSPGLVGELGSGLGFGPTTTGSTTYFVHVSPGNYSYVDYALNPNEQLAARVTTGQQAIDFFLMNEGNFTAWAGGGTQPNQVYPQSSLNVKNYTFLLPGSDHSQDYFMVFVSRTNASTTDVILRLTLEDTSAVSTFAFAPIALVGAGAILAVLGVGTGRGQGSASEAAGIDEGPPAALSGWGSLLGMAGPKCKYCGAALDEGSSFCPSCKKSQG